MTDDPKNTIAEAAEKLINSFDSVVILCTHYDGDGTVIKYATRGNTYAINGSLREFLTWHEGAPFEGDDADAS